MPTQERLFEVICKVPEGESLRYWGSSIGHGWHRYSPPLKGTLTEVRSNVNRYNARWGPQYKFDVWRSA